MKKISVITVVKNGMPYIDNAVKSFQLQNYINKEHIIIYSPSTDNTEIFLNKINFKNVKVFKDKDSKNLYSSINKGIELCTGEIIGLLHSDDIFFNEYTLDSISNSFDPDIDCLYGDILFSKKSNISKIKRVWKSGNYNNKNLKFGWLPAHTSIYIKKSVFNKIKYNTEYEISSDFELILNIFHNRSLKKKYLEKYLCIMRLGGKSTNVKNILRKLEEDIKISEKYFSYKYLYLILKIMRKVNQFKFFGYNINNKYLKNFN